MRNIEVKIFVRSFRALEKEFIMNEEVQLFTFESIQVRTLVINGEPWFIGKDVATIL